MTVITKSATTPVSKATEVLDLDAALAPLFDELSNVKYVRQEAEKREKELKAQILASLPARTKGVKFVLRVGGVIRANVSLRSRTTIKNADLLAAFPEAYAACANETDYDVLDPA